MFELPPIEPIMLTPVTAECVQHSALSYHVHPDILYAILIVEGGAVGETTAGANENGTRDIGPAQINSIHLDELASLGVTEKELKDNGCLNIYVQARYLSIVLSQVSRLEKEDDYLYAIARFHSKDRTVARPYVKKLESAFELMYREQSDTGAQNE